MAADLYDAIWRALDAPISMDQVQLRRAIGLLPADPEWAISEDTTTVWALSSGTLFTVRVEGNSATVTSTPVDPSTLTVGVSWTEDAAPPTSIGKERRAEGIEENWRESHWTFGHRDGEEYLQITGRTKTTIPVEGETGDRRELFARALASRAGWGTADS